MEDYPVLLKVGSCTAICKKRDTLMSKSLFMYLQMSGQTLDDNDPDVNLFWEYLDGAIFVAPSVNLLMLAMPFLRYLPGVYKRTFDKMVVIKEKMTQRYFTTMKVTLNKTNSLVL